VATGTMFANVAPVPAFAPNGTFRFFAPYVVLGTVMYVTLNNHILRAVRSNGVWGAGSDLPAPINIAGNNIAAAVTPDELHIYWASDRTGSQGLDIWGSSRAKNAD